MARRGSAAGTPVFPGLLILVLGAALASSCRDDLELRRYCRGLMSCHATSTVLEEWRWLDARVETLEDGNNEVYCW